MYCLNVLQKLASDKRNDRQTVAGVKKMIGEFKIADGSKFVGRKVKDVCKEFGVTLLYYGKHPSGTKVTKK